MSNRYTIIVTGAAGFIGSCFVEYLNKNGYHNLILVDDFSQDRKEVNWQNKKYTAKVERNVFFNWLNQYPTKIDIIVHLGARTDTTEFDYSIHQELNVNYSKKIWNHCQKHNIPLIYASSAATYGKGEFGYNDDHYVIEKLKPLNPYGVSKNEFDKWALHQNNQLTCWAGLKLFNIYGPNEYHKGIMASVIFHSFNQIKKNGVVNLFRSHNPNYKNGEQLRDFVYVIDLLKVMLWMMNQMMANQWAADKNGIYNIGTGKARSFYDLAVATFKGLDKEPDIKFVDMPVEIRDKYQYFTEANMGKLAKAGYMDDFYTLEQGVDDYVRNYLTNQSIY